MRKLNIAIFCNLEGTGGHHAQWNKSGEKEQILDDHTYLRYVENKGIDSS